MTPSAHTQHTALKNFCLEEAGCILIPAEALNADGLNTDFAQALIETNRMTDAQMARLERGFSIYWNRCHALFKQAPGSWFPPRQINLLLISDKDQVSPYLEPFPNVSCTLYLSDLDTHPEYVAYMLVHAERLSMLHSVGPTLTYNQSWWLLCDNDTIEHFKEGVRKAQRPDAAIFALVAQSLTWVDKLLHNPLRQPAQHIDEPYVCIKGADLYIPKNNQSDWMSVCTQSETILREAMAKPSGHSMPRTNSIQALEHLCDWVQDQATRVALSESEIGVFSTPQNRAIDTLRHVLVNTPSDVIRSLLDDLILVQTRSQTFFDALRCPQRLPTRCAILEQGGGVYVDARNHWIVYELNQPSFDARTRQAPPFHRRLLGARVMHEWGHLAHEANFLYIPETHKSAYQAARADIGIQWMRILRAAPARMHAEIEAQLATLTAQTALAPEAALARKTLSRVGDYLSNRLAAHLIPPEELHAYVRVNVRHHMDEALDFISELARYAYEIQYLTLVGLPRSYFFDTSHFNDYFIDSGLVHRNHIEQLFDAVYNALSCYTIDTQAITITHQ